MHLHREPRFFALLLLSLLACLVSAQAAAADDPSAAPPQRGPGPFNLTLFHTNDTHSHFLPRPATWRDDGRPVGGAIPLAWHLARERETAPASLLVDAGDFMTGNPVCTLVVDGVLGGAIAELMNALGYDAGLIGNHEFDIGREDLDALVGRFDYPLLAADIVDEQGRPEFRFEPVVLERGGLRVGILGVSCAGMREVVTDSRLGGLRMAEQAGWIGEQAARLDPDTDLLILMTHNGVEEDRRLAGELAGAGIDVLVGGHSHTRLQEPELVGEILIVQAGGNWTNLGRLDLAVEGDRVVRYDGRLVTLWADGAQAGPALTAVVKKYETMMDRRFRRRIGTAAVDLRRGRGETNIGNWLADCIGDRAGADVALVNSGTIRRNLNAGPITALDIHELLPFSNVLVTVELSGSDLAAIVQTNADSQVSGRHGILQVSGLEYEFRARPDGEAAQVTSIRVGKQVLDPQRTYRVAMPDYVAMMADVYLGVPLPPVQDVGVTMTGAVLQAVEAAGTVNAAIEGRIRRLD